MNADGARPVGSEAELADLYGEASPNALAKEIDHLNAPYRAFVAAAPFLILSTVGPEGLDASPRGDPPGFVEVSPDGRTLLIPDRLGNNRIDSLRNIVRDDRVALLFLVPGVGETLRVNGRATILAGPDLLARFAVNGKAPRSVVRVEVERAYFQCQKALVRSRLWKADAQVERAALPSAGAMLAATARDFDADAYDRAYPERLAQTIY